MIVKCIKRGLTMQSRLAYNVSATLVLGLQAKTKHLDLFCMVGKLFH